MAEETLTKARVRVPTTGGEYEHDSIIAQVMASRVSFSILIKDISRGTEIEEGLPRASPESSGDAPIPEASPDASDEADLAGENLQEVMDWRGCLSSCLRSRVENGLDPCLRRCCYTLGMQSLRRMGENRMVWSTTRFSRVVTLSRNASVLASIDMFASCPHVTSVHLWNICIHTLRCV